MSTYIDSRNPKKHSDYRDLPPMAQRFLRDSETIRGQSPRTANAYYIDLRTFFRFLKQYRGLCAADIAFENIPILDIDEAFIQNITTEEIYEFLYFVTKDRENAPATRSRKLSSLRSFFKYLCKREKVLTTNPAEEVDSPAIKKRLPKYLTLQESIELLKSVNSDFYERDFCIITLFLNCGMRLSELVNINVTDIQEDTIRIVGKGDKERLVYLNDACHDAIDQLLAARGAMPNLQDDKALFVSKRTGRRVSARRVQQIVTGCLAAAGLSGKGYSTHKLRHTAATMMYQEGGVDMLALKEILGHEHVSTTEIYTHMGTVQLKKAAQSSPFAELKFEKPMQNADTNNEKNQSIEAEQTPSAEKDAVE